MALLPESSSAAPPAPAQQLNTHTTVLGSHQSPTAFPLKPALFSLMLVVQLILETEANSQTRCHHLYENTRFCPMQPDHHMLRGNKKQGQLAYTHSHPTSQSHFL